MGYTLDTASMRTPALTSTELSTIQAVNGIGPNLVKSVTMSFADEVELEFAYSPVQWWRYHPDLTKKVLDNAPEKHKPLTKLVGQHVAYNEALGDVNPRTASNTHRVANLDRKVCAPLRQFRV
jgi:hypothetical protein